MQIYVYIVYIYLILLVCWKFRDFPGEAPHLEDKKIMFGNNQLLQVDFMRPSSTTCFPSQG